MDLELRRKLSMKKQPVKLLGIAGIVNKVIKDYNYDENVIQILLRLQRNFGWLPMEMLSEANS
ncbi:MAG: hypothetical protein ACUVTM_08690 [Candidatus Bathyarchaeia archaeon]